MPDPSPQGTTSTRLDTRDVRALLLWLLAGLLGAGVAYRYFFEAFPEAAVDFQVTRESALSQARAFVQERGFPLAGYQSAIVFSVDDNEKTYLEKEVRLAEANRLMSADVNVWYWAARFFKPPQQEEFRVNVDPAGRIVGYRHILEEAAAGERLEHDQAMALAETFLRDTLHTPLGAYTFLPAEADSSILPNRTDWSFSWERTGFRVKDAPYRLVVSLAGDRIAGYQEILQVPEAWQREYDRMRSQNNLLAAIASIPYVLLIGAALSVALGLGRRGQAPWAGALKFGLFITALYFTMQMNQWPLARFDYDTNGSYSSFVLNQVGLALGASLLMSLLLVIALVPGEPLYRVSQPGQLRMGSFFSLPALRSKEFFVSGSVGLCMAAAHIGYVVLFYVVGREFGVWAPQDLQYSDTLSTALPWIFPLTIGIYASASEEFLFRLFAIPWLMRITRSKALAVVLPAMAWGFLHANYPQEPAYIRGIEVGVIGIVAGLVMLRWGILATLMWHYTVDAFLVGLSLMRSADLYSRISGAGVGLLGLIAVGVAGVLYLKSGRFADSSEMLNAAEPLTESPSVSEPTAIAPAPAASYTPLNIRALGILVSLAVAGIGLLVVARTPQIGEFVRFELDSGQAETRAAGILREQDVAPEPYRRAATIQYRFDPQVNEYLRRSIGIEKANRVYQTEAPTTYWTVRFFRDSQKEEYMVVLRPDGVLHAVHHTLPEEAPGANLTKEAAQEIAEAYLLQAKMMDLSQWNLVDSRSDKLPARTDHVFTWEQKAAVASLDGNEGAHVRMDARVQGDEPSGYRVYVHLPEEWLRRQNQNTLATTAHSTALFGLMGAFVVAVLVAFLGNLRHPAATAVPWRKLAKWAVAVLTAFVVWVFTNVPLYLSRYPTENSLSTYLGMTTVSFVLASAALYGAVFVLLGLGWFFVTRSFGAEALPGGSARPKAYYRDAVVVGVSGVPIVAALPHLHQWLQRVWPTFHHEFPAHVPTGLDAAPPALQSLASTVMFGFVVIGLLALVTGFASYYLRDAWKQALVLGLVAFVAAPRWGSTADLLQSFLAGWAALLLLWWVARSFFRFNLHAYFLTVMLLMLTNAAVELLRQPNSYYHANGGVLLAAALALLLWTWRAWRRASQSADAVTGSSDSIVSI